MLHDGEELALLDVREAGEFGASHLLFATPLPYSRLEADVFRLIPRRNVRIVLCDAGDADVAPRAAERLLVCGYTDVSVLDGGTRSWADAGYGLFAGVNVPSKLFGKLVEHEYGTPRISARDLLDMKARGEPFLLLDGRPLGEHHRMTIPGSTCCPNAELPYRFASMVRDPQAKIVVNCAGRTRSILGAQTLINFGVPNPVYALENGTQGWRLADLDLEYGSSRKYPDTLDEAALPAQQAAARALRARFSIEMASVPMVEEWLRNAHRTTYVCDIRTPEEFAAGSLPGAVHAPGGQLVQATDQWIGVRNSRIVLADSGEHVRAPVIASWLMQLGYDAWVLEGGVQSGLVVPPSHPPALPEVATITPQALNERLAACALFDLRSSMQFRKRHIRGSRWSIRPRIIADIGNVDRPVVLVADEDVARLAAIDLRAAGVRTVWRLAGGVEAWAAQGYPTESTPGVPPDGECIDYLFFVHDRHAGNREAMRQYLAWETGLIGQLSPEDRELFRVGFPPRRTDSRSAGR